MDFRIAHCTAGNADTYSLCVLRGINLDTHLPSKMFEPQDELVNFVVVTGISFLPSGNEDIFSGRNCQMPPLAKGQLALLVSWNLDTPLFSAVFRFVFASEILSNCHGIVSSIPLKVHGFGKSSLNTTSG